MLKYMCLLIIIIVSSCSSNKKNNADIDFVNDKNEVKPIDIKAPFFWMVRPWKEGKLVTLDGWGRYAEISFSGANKMAIKSLVEFPRVQQDGWGFMTWPESGVIASKSGKMDHIAAVDDNKTKSHVPLLTWVHNEPYVVLLDPDEGLIAYQYSLNRNDRDIGVSLFIYNYKTDTMVYETPDPGAPSPQKYNIDMQMAIDDRYMLSNSSTYHDGWRSDNFFYDWKKGEITRNDLTEFLNQNNSYVFDNCVHLGRRYLFIKVEEDEDNDKLLKIDWDEEYSNIRVTDMSSLFQEIYKKSYSISALDLIISSDGSWVTTTITDFSEYNSDDINNRFITTRVFFHVDNKYPNGISIPIFSDGDERSENTNHDEGAFVRHPAYGMCYAQEWHSEEKIYLRLYKMDDVLTAINSGSLSLPFNHDDSKNYLFTRVYTYDKKLIKGWIFEEEDPDIETNQAIDLIINYCETEMRQTPQFETDNQLSRVELYKNCMHGFRFLDKNNRIYFYINRANEDNNIYYLEVDFFVLEYDDSPDYFRQHKMIISNQYFNYAESGHDVQKHVFWDHYNLLREGEAAYKFFLNEIEKQRR